MKSKNMITDISVYIAAIRPVLTYTAETMNFTSLEYGKLKSFERRIIRRIY